MIIRTFKSSIEIRRLVVVLVVTRRAEQGDEVINTETHVLQLVSRKGSRGERTLLLLELSRQGHQR